MEHYCTNLTLLELEKLPEHTDVFQLENGKHFAKHYFIVSCQIINHEKRYYIIT